MQNEVQYPLTWRFLQGRLRHAMTDEEQKLLESLVSETEIIEDQKVIINRGDFCDFSTVLVEGYILRTIHENNERSIVGFQVAGDFVDLHAFALKRLDHDLMVIGQAKLAYVQHDDLKLVLQTHPHLARLLWFSTLLDAAIHREWIMKFSTLRATGRVAHLLAEIWYRLRMVNLGSSDGFQTPFTQIHLSTICGMSTVHMTRCLSDLRDGGVVDFRQGKITILDEEKLKSIGKFDPTYLYGEGGLAVGDALNIGSPESLAEL